MSVLKFVRLQTDKQMTIFLSPFGYRASAYTVMSQQGTCHFRTSVSILYFCTSHSVLQCFYLPCVTGAVLRVKDDDFQPIKKWCMHEAVCS